MEVTVIRSAKRRKTAQARLVDGVLEVRIPARSSQAEERRLVEVFRRRYERAGAAERIDLAARARTLARRHDLPEPTEIRWVANQARRWGSCTPADGTIRISDRLADFPTWVIDHVIVHELAHLVEPGHGPAFAALAGRYPLAERAEGYLLAKSDGIDPAARALDDDVDVDVDGTDPDIERSRAGPDRSAAGEPPPPDRAEGRLF
ncbi:MAG TPA: M48 family metallopeptidase [Aquihabitans sp.]|nr:M48 family metallopeptidase [Aquihabitans sp.]